MSNIETAAVKLAACIHPTNQIQRLRPMDDRAAHAVHRCSDCGSVLYVGDVTPWPPGWTPPFLVAQVCGAVRLAARGAEVVAPLPDSFFEPTLVARIVEDSQPLLHERPITVRNLETLEHTINLAKSWLAKRSPPGES